MLYLFSIIFVVTAVNANDDQKLIIDNDAGGDDSMALFIALLCEKHFQGPKVIALMTGNGNTHEDNVYTNNKKILDVAKRREIPIHRGCKESLAITPNYDNYFGVDGLGNNHQLLSDPLPPQKQGAVLALLELVKKHPNKITLVTIGTLTNVALAIKLDPEFLSRLNHLYVGGGHIFSEMHPKAEFNVLMDVEAYHIVAKHATPDKVTVLPFSQVSKYLNISMDWRQNILGGLDIDIMRAQNEYEKVALDKQSEIWEFLDSATVSLALINVLEGPRKHDFVTEYKYSKNAINLCGEDRGINTNTFVEQKDANVRIAYSFDAENFKTFLFDVFSADVNKPK